MAAGEYWKKDQTKLFQNPQNSARTKLVQSNLNLNFADDQMPNAAWSTQYYFSFLILGLLSAGEKY